MFRNFPQQFMTISRSTRQNGHAQSLPFCRLQFASTIDTYVSQKNRRHSAPISFEPDCTIVRSPRYLNQDRNKQKKKTTNWKTPSCIFLLFAGARLDLLLLSAEIGSSFIRPKKHDSMLTAYGVRLSPSRLGISSSGRLLPGPST